MSDLTPVFQDSQTGEERPSKWWTRAFGGLGKPNFLDPQTREEIESTWLARLGGGLLGGLLGGIVIGLIGGVLSVLYDFGCLLWLGAPVGCPFMDEVKGLLLQGLLIGGVFGIGCGIWGGLCGGLGGLIRVKKRRVWSESLKFGLMLGGIGVLIGSMSFSDFPGWAELCGGVLGGLLGGLLGGAFAKLCGGVDVKIHDFIARRQHYHRQRVLQRKLTEAEWKHVPKTALSQAQPTGEPQPTDASLSQAGKPEEEKPRLAGGVEVETEAEEAVVRTQAGNRGSPL